MDQQDVESQELEKLKLFKTISLIGHELSSQGALSYIFSVQGTELSMPKPIVENSFFRTKKPRDRQFEYFQTTPRGRELSKELVKALIKATEILTTEQCGKGFVFDVQLQKIVVSFNFENLELRFERFEVTKSKVNLTSQVEELQKIYESAEGGMLF